MLIPLPFTPSDKCLPISELFPALKRVCVCVCACMVQEGGMLNAHDDDSTIMINHETDV